MVSSHAAAKPGSPSRCVDREPVAFAKKVCWFGSFGLGDGEC